LDNQKSKKVKSAHNSGGANVICMICNKPFLIWKDEYGDPVDDVCRICDMDEYEQMIEDREKEN